MTTVSLVPPATDLLRAPPTTVFIDPTREPWNLTMLTEAPLGSPMVRQAGTMASLFRDLLGKWQDEIGTVNNESKGLQAAVDQGAAGQQAIVRLAVIGNYVFHEVLDGLRPGVRSDLRAALAARVAGTSTAPLVFMAPSPLPWRALYIHPSDPDRRLDDAATPEDVPIDGFLGCAAVVDHVHVYSDPVPAAGQRVVPVGIYTELDTTTERTKIHDALARRADLNLQFESDPTAFLAAVRRGAALVYAYCHGRFQSGTAATVLQELHLNDRSLTAEDVRRSLVKTNGRLTASPIAFINACQGGVFDGDASSTVAQALLDAGARASIGPLVDMPVVFGSAWGAAILRGLGDDQTVGDAVRTATVQFLEEQNNPLGLVYSTVHGHNQALPPSSTTPGGRP